MKNFLTLLILLLAISIADAQEGLTKFYHPNGKISAEGMMKNGQPVGVWKSYYPDGILKSAGKRKNNKPDSIWNFYDRKGNLQNSISYRNGMRNGYAMQYDFSNDSNQTIFLKEKILYLNDKKNGKSEYFNPNGSLHKTINFKDGYKHGKEVFYNDTGLIITIVSYHYDNITDSENINRIDQKGRKQGTWKTFHPNNRIKEIIPYLDGKLHGYKRTYNIKGKLLNTEYYINGKIQKIEEKTEENNQPKVTLRRKYYPNGSIKEEGNFVNNKRTGTHNYYNENRKITHSIDYNDDGIKTASGLYNQKGQRQGEWQFFYADGKIKSQGSYKNGKRQGKWNFYFPNNKTEQIGKYQNGKPHGNWKWYYQSGQVRRIGKFKNGKEAGTFVEFAQNGDTISYGNYMRGLKEGEFKRKVNDITYIENFSYGELNGMSKQFYQNKKLAFKGEYQNNLPEGEHIYYYPNGKVKLKAYYFSGVKTKKWYSFSEDGILTCVTEYRNNKKIKIDGIKIKTEKN